MSSSSETRAITVEDFDRICRICLEEENLCPIQGTSITEINVTDLLEQTVITDIKNEHLPQNVCQKCLDELCKVYEYKKQCEAVEDMLKQLLEISQQDVINVNEPLKSNIISFANDESSNAIDCDLSAETDLQSFDDFTTNETIINRVFPSDNDEISKDNLSAGKGSESTTHKLSEENAPKNKVPRKKCSDCDYSAPSQERLEQHCLRWHRRFRCKICDNMVFRKERQCHMDFHIKPHRCEICSEHFACPKTLKLHKDTHTEEELQKFKNLRKPIQRVQGLPKPIQREQELPKPIQCELCGEMVLPKVLRRHMSNHTPPYECKICFKWLSCAKSLKRHEMIHTGDRRMICSFCGKSFSEKKSMKKHEERYHSDQIFERKKHTCEYCDRKFIRLDYFIAHVKNHTAEKAERTRDYVCETCGSSFMTQGVLHSHKQTHGEKKFLCHICDKRFALKSALRNHLRVHTGEKPYTCTVCTKSFTLHTGLVYHTRTHTGVKPYKCSFCSKTFTQSTHLNYHLKTHTGEKSYTCKYCDKSFALNGTLTVHMRLHTGETPYKCPTCQKGHISWGGMMKHWRSHNEEEREKACVEKEAESETPPDHAQLLSK